LSSTDERYAALYQRQQLLQRRELRSLVPPIVRRPSSPDVRARTSPLDPAKPFEIVIVEDDGNAVGDELQVALDCKTSLDSPGEGGKRIFPDCLVHVVEAAMGDRLSREPG